jgi:hypothetical protein
MHDGVLGMPLASNFLPNGMNTEPFRTVQRPTAGNDVTMFVALLATALAMGGALAHALELPNKIGLSREHYFIAQQLYRGWNQLAYLLVVEASAMVVLATRFRRTRHVFLPTVAAIGCLALAQAVFWVWTFPANIATENWTITPSNWEALRTQWEYSHLAGAGFQVLALCALIVAALARRRTIDG